MTVPGFSFDSRNSHRTTQDVERFFEFWKMLFMNNVTPPDSGISHKEENTQIFVESKCCGAGTLYIAENCVCWIGENGRGLTFEYPAISLHAVSRDTTAFPHECIYMQISLKLEMEAETGMEADHSDEESSPDEDFDPCTVVRFVPANSSSLNSMFTALSDCQTLHPDPDDSEEETEFFNSAGDASDLTHQGLITLQRLDGMLRQGEDAPEMTAMGEGHANGDEADDADDDYMEEDETPDQ